MSTQPLSKAQANLKAALWDIDASKYKSHELFMELMDLGLPKEVATRIHDLLSKTAYVAGKTLNIGKIIVLKILEFIKAHPFLVTGLGIGATVGAAIAALITGIPFIGPLLAPIAAALGLTITVAGAVIGHSLDKALPGFGQSVVEIAQSFFKLITEVFNLVFGEIREITLAS
ncbi:MAG: hypothetical protein ACO331_15960 [Prochlorothrix sp.]